MGLKMPLPEKEQFTGSNVTEQGFKNAQDQLIDYIGTAVATKTTVKSYMSGKISVNENSVCYSTDGTSLITSYQNSFFFADIAVNAGEWYLITSTSSGDVRSYYIATAENVLKKYGEATVSAEFIKIPEGCTRLIVNSLKTARDSFSVKLISTDEYNLFQQMKSIPDVTSNIQQSLSGKVTTTANKIIYSQDGVTVTSVQNSAFFVADLSVEANAWYLITSTSTGDVRAVYTAKDNSIKTYSDVVVASKFIQIPTDANRLIINCLNSASDSFSVKLLAADEVTLFKNAQKTNEVTVLSAFPQRPSYTDLLQSKCPNFYNKLKNKSGDLTLCLTGTSLTLGSLYATDRTDGTTRPPLLHANDLASAIFDSIISYWDGQQYRRYDHAHLTYSSSDWSTINTLSANSTAVWDDNAVYRNGMTKTTTSANASVSITIPNDAWQFNFIYRSDSQGGNCTIAIAEGNSKVEVFNGTNWVEANSYTFSMLESAATATKGNTIYQKRLKMRCKNKATGGINSLGSTKQITITKANDASRLNVVGFEWSPREYMFTLVNSARGSHNWGLSNGFNLESYQDCDIWNFNPDLILCEATVINWGGSWGYDVDPLNYVNIAKRTYFNEFNDNANSLFAKSNSYTKCEIVFYGDTVSAHESQITSWNGKQPKFAAVVTAATNGDGSTENIGRVKNIFENYSAVEQYMSSKQYVFIPVSTVFKNVAEKFYGNYWDAFRGTDKSGSTLSYDAIHLNDNGVALWSLLICPLFENL